MLAVDQFIIMTGGNPRGQTFTSVYWIYQNSFIFFKLGYGSALSIILMLIIFGFAAAQIILTRRRADSMSSVPPDVGRRRRGRARDRRRRGRTRCASAAAGVRHGQTAAT